MQEQQEEQIELTEAKPARKKGWNGPEGSRNNNGRPKKDPNERVSKRSIRDKELIMLARKVRPHLADSITTAARIMRDKDASDTNKIKVAAFLTSLYRDLMDDVYNGADQEDEGTEVQPQNNGPVFSLTILDNKEKTGTEG